MLSAADTAVEGAAESHTLMPPLAIDWASHIMVGCTDVEIVVIEAGCILQSHNGKRQAGRDGGGETGEQGPSLGRAV